MNGPAPALRFLVVVLGGWIVIRAGTLAFWQEQPVPVAATHPSRAIAREAAPRRPARPAQAVPPTNAGHDLPELAGRRPAFARDPQAPAPADIARCAPSVGPTFLLPIPARIATLQDEGSSLSFTRMPPGTSPAPAGRWSGSAWSLVRRGSAAPVLAPNGTLGGSQAGARLTYRLSRDDMPLVRLSGRVYLPLRQVSGAEAAIGIDWQPVRRLPLYLLAERRQALGEDGRSAFSLTLYGGGSAQLPFDVRIDSYAQGGIVGTRSRDPFVDGAVHLRRPIGPVEVGAGAWGAAQPGAERIDIGPHVSVRLPVQRTNLRLSADWRFRVAGDAAPGSGPALTLGADF